MYVIRIYVLIFYVQWMPLMDVINGCIYMYQKHTWTLMDVSTYQKPTYITNDKCH